MGCVQQREKILASSVIDKKAVNTQLFTNFSTNILVGNKENNSKSEQNKLTLDFKRNSNPRKSSLKKISGGQTKLKTNSVIIIDDKNYDTTQCNTKENKKLSLMKRQFLINKDIFTNKKIENSIVFKICQYLANFSTLKEYFISKPVLLPKEIKELEADLCQFKLLCSTGNKIRNILIYYMRSSSENPFIDFRHNTLYINSSLKKDSLFNFQGSSRLVLVDNTNVRYKSLSPRRNYNLNLKRIIEVKIYDNFTGIRDLASEDDEYEFKSVKGISKFNSFG